MILLKVFRDSWRGFCRNWRVLDKVAEFITQSWIHIFE
jgi:hypothetical protein